LTSVSFVVGQSPPVSLFALSYLSFVYLISCIEILNGLKFVLLLCTGT